MQLELTPDERFEIDPLGVMPFKDVAEQYVRKWYPTADCIAVYLGGHCIQLRGKDLAVDQTRRGDAWIAAANAIKRAVDERKNTTT